MSETDGLVHWFDLPEEMVIRLDPKFASELMKKMPRMKMAKITNLPDNTLRRVEESGKILVRTLLKICNGLGIKPSEIESKIIGVSSLNVKMPIDFNTKFGFRFIGGILSDGTITRSNLVEYTNGSIMQLLRMLEAAYNLFGDFKARIVKGKKNSIALQFPSTFRYLLEKVGLPVGSKSKANISLPVFILNGSKANKAEYLRQAFSDDGYAGDKIGIGRMVDITNIVNFEIPQNIRASRIPRKDEISKHVPRLLLSEKKLLEDLGIKFSEPRLDSLHKSRNGRITALFKMEISRWEEVVKFAKSVGFSHERKQKELENLINSKKPFNFEMQKDIINLYTHFKDSKFCIEDIMNATNKSYVASKTIGIRLTKKGILQRIKPGVYQFTPYGKEKAKYYKELHELKFLKNEEIDLKLVHLRRNTYLVTKSNSGIPAKLLLQKLVSQFQQTVSFPRVKSLINFSIF
jgi:DNA-binding Xre family transcriptional regulator